MTPKCSYIPCSFLPVNVPVSISLRVVAYGAGIFGLLQSLLWMIVHSLLALLYYYSYEEWYATDWLFKFFFTVIDQDTQKYFSFFFLVMNVSLVAVSLIWLIASIHLIIYAKRAKRINCGLCGPPDNMAQCCVRCAFIFWGIVTFFVCLVDLFFAGILLYTMNAPREVRKFLHFLPAPPYNETDLQIPTSEKTQRHEANDDEFINNWKKPTDKKVPPGRTQRISPEIINNLPDLIKILPPELIGNLPELINKLPSGILQKLPSLLSKLPPGAIGKLPELINKLPPEILQNLPELIDKLPPEAIGNLPDLINKLSPGILENLPEAVGNHSEKTNKGPPGILENLPGAMGNLSGIINKLPPGIIGNLPGAIGNLSGITNNLPQGTLENLTELVNKLPTGITGKLPGLVNNITPRTPENLTIDGNRSAITSKLSIAALVKLPELVTKLPAHILEMVLESMASLSNGSIKTSNDLTTPPDSVNSKTFPDQPSILTQNPTNLNLPEIADYQINRPSDLEIHQEYSKDLSNRLVDSLSISTDLSFILDEPQDPENFTEDPKDLPRDQVISRKYFLEDLPTYSVDANLKKYPTGDVLIPPDEITPDPNHPTSPGHSGKDHFSEHEFRRIKRPWIISNDPDKYLSNGLQSSRSSQPVKTIPKKSKTKYRENIISHIQSTLNKDSNPRWSDLSKIYLNSIEPFQHPTTENTKAEDLSKDNLGEKMEIISVDRLKLGHKSMDETNRIKSLQEFSGNLKSGLKVNESSERPVLISENSSPAFDVLNSAVTSPGINGLSTSLDTSSSSSSYSSSPDFNTSTGISKDTPLVLPTSFPNTDTSLGDSSTPITNTSSPIPNNSFPVSNSSASFRNISLLSKNPSTISRISNISSAVVTNIRTKLVNDLPNGMNNLFSKITNNIGEMINKIHRKIKSGDIVEAERKIIGKLARILKQNQTDLETTTPHASEQMKGNKNFYSRLLEIAKKKHEMMKNSDDPETSKLNKDPPVPDLVSNDTSSTPRSINRTYLEYMSKFLDPNDTWTVQLFSKHNLSDRNKPLTLYDLLPNTSELYNKDHNIRKRYIPTFIRRLVWRYIWKYIDRIIKKIKSYLPSWPSLFWPNWFWPEDDHTEDDYEKLKASKEENDTIFFEENVVEVLTPITMWIMRGVVLWIVNFMLSALVMTAGIRGFSSLISGSQYVMGVPPEYNTCLKKSLFYEDPCNSGLSPCCDTLNCFRNNTYYPSMDPPCYSDAVDDVCYYNTMQNRMADPCCPSSHKPKKKKKNISFKDWPCKPSSTCTISTEKHSKKKKEKVKKEKKQKKKNKKNKNVDICERKEEPPNKPKPKRAKLEPLEPCRIKGRRREKGNKCCRLEIGIPSNRKQPRQVGRKSPCANQVCGRQPCRMRPPEGDRPPCPPREYSSCQTPTYGNTSREASCGIQTYDDLQCTRSTSCHDEECPNRSTDRPTSSRDEECPNRSSDRPTSSRRSYGSQPTSSQSRCDPSYYDPSRNRPCRNETYVSPSCYPPPCDPPPCDPPPCDLPPCDLPPCDPPPCYTPTSDSSSRYAPACDLTPGRYRPKRNYHYRPKM